jgi:hypothetical protein
LIFFIEMDAGRRSTGGPLVKGTRPLAFMVERQEEQ